MAGVGNLGSAPIIISQNLREEIRLTLRRVDGLRYIDLRTYSLDPGNGKALPTERAISINLECWSQFRSAVSSPETWTEILPFWDEQMPHAIGRGRSIFPAAADHPPTQQKQIYLEYKDFRGITFILLKSLTRSRGGRPRGLITIGPILWVQFMTGLKEMEELLINLGLLPGKDEKAASRLEEIPVSPVH